MLLAIDVGNTNLTFGIMGSHGVEKSFRMTTQTSRTSDEFAFRIVGLMERQGVTPEQIHDVAISSVVPKVMHSLVNGCYKAFGKKPLIIGPGVKTGIQIKRTNPAEVGADRIADAVGAYSKYGGPAIVIDFGTATTYDVVGPDGAYEYGVTAPGIRICAKALWEDTAKLPEVEIITPKSILATNTIESMQAGLVYGYIGQTEYIVDHLKKETGYTDAKVIATGGLARMIMESTDRIDILDGTLTLDGIQCIYNRNRRD